MAVYWQSGFPQLIAQQAPSTPTNTTKQSGAVFQLNETAPVQENTLQTFERTIKEFQISLSQLPSEHKKEIRTIYASVTSWADEQQAAKKKVDRLATFTGKVCEYCNGKLTAIEKTDPDLLRRRPEHDLLNDVFYKGAALINAYEAYAKDKTQP